MRDNINQARIKSLKELIKFATFKRDLIQKQLDVEYQAALKFQMQFNIDEMNVKITQIERELQDLL